jgi:hypothetical protein
MSSNAAIDQRHLGSARRLWAIRHEAGVRCLLHARSVMLDQFELDRQISGTLHVLAKGASWTS